MNTFMNSLQNTYNFKRTENGALAHKSTGSAVYDMFAMGAAYRSRSDAVLYQRLPRRPGRAQILPRLYEMAGRESS